MASIRFEEHSDLAIIQRRRVAIIGYGSQGHAHALNLRDSGVDVRIGLRPTSNGATKASLAGFEVMSVSDAARWGEVIVVLVPDTAQPAVYREHIAPQLTAGKMLLFAHGFNIRYGTIEVPRDVDVTLVAPKGPGHRVRETYVEGGGVPCLLAVQQDASGEADAIALSYAAGLGAGRAGVLTTTFAEETETDLFGEQAVLCGGVSELVKAGFNTLVEAGYQPEIAYFECLHELKLIVDLIYRGGLRYMRYSISDTAEYGDYECGPRIIDDSVRERMRELLAEIQDGTFARKWIAESEAGFPAFETRRSSERELPIETVGNSLRQMMSFIDPVTVVPQG
jgi:ketol-acid reductoisomerase